MRLSPPTSTVMRLESRHAFKGSRLHPALQLWARVARFNGASAPGPASDDGGVVAEYVLHAPAVQ